MSIQNDLGSVLHNMSTPPKSVVKFEGLGGLARNPTAEGATAPPLGDTAPRVFGTPVRFVLPPELRRLKPAGLLRRLEPASKLRSSAAREARLEELIEERAAALPLPEGCIVIVPNDRHPILWDDLLTALAVLAKCTDTVWLRGKTPSLLSAIQRGTVSLLVPPAFAVHLPAAPPPSPSQPAIGDRHDQ
jgi:hypothetical protein